MIIRIKKDGEDTNEWAIIELQGDLESRTNQSLNDQFIGDLHYTKTGTPILIVGHHILYGKEVSLDKPFAVLEKIHYNENDQVVDKSMSDSRTRTEYTVRAIVKKKLVFRVRPKPIIANVPKMV
ncbi:chromosome transmission fidelity protein 8 homolog [Neodiprion virginianus]|uniref:Chromosome transmission fidelity protein 8 homolog n=1 Tax=Neodiprion lecontei TaxID=441921 RepID=A0A6J0BM30_NEOLC|nr:chromosome transmission fidelity protein 8 homolog [Neodiprion lecontei]XP_046433760.1 chromosome transmission fidelity protein 8 homolog [Neodiprion fabricii]XP_046628878.1 chromosome transmission fidelity protein 8 homolog [Neodiprion virginianus]